MGKLGRLFWVFCKQTNVGACRFQNECNKVEILLRVVQFLSEIKLVITNCNHAFDFRPIDSITIINLSHNCEITSILLQSKSGQKVWN